MNADAVFAGEVAAAAQYGAKIAALVVYLQHWHFIPEDRLAELMKDVLALQGIEWVVLRGTPRRGRCGCRFSVF